MHSNEGEHSMWCVSPVGKQVKMIKNPFEAMLLRGESYFRHQSCR